MEHVTNTQAESCLQHACITLALTVLFLLSLTPGISMTEDLGRHLLLGRIIWSGHHIPNTNFLTYTHPDFPFVNHHWLSQVVFYLAHRLIGVNGIILVKAILLAASLAIASATVPVRRLSPLYLLTLSLCAMTIAYRAHVRPELFTYLGVALYGLLLTRLDAARRPRQKAGCWLLIMLYGLFWANAHIYFIFGVGMVGAWLLSRWVFWISARVRGTHRLPLSDSLLFAMLCLACCLNPNGWRGFLYPFNIFKNYGIGITENISPVGLWETVLNPMMLALPILSLITLFAAATCAIRWRTMTPVQLARMIIALTAFGATWRMARSAPLLALTLPPLLGFLVAPPRIMAAAPGRALFKGIPRNRCVRGIPASCIMLLDILLIITILGGSYHRVFPSPIGPTPFGLDEEPRYLALRRLQQQGLRGPLFNDYNIGSLVDYNLYPTPAYTDNRPEAFPYAFWQDEYLPALHDINRWNQLLENRDVQTIIVSLTGVKEPFVRMMMFNTDWQLVHLDFLCAVWVRKSPGNEIILRNATYTYDDLHAYRDAIAERILTLDAQPFWKRQVIADQIVYELYSLICIHQPALAWPLILQMHLRYPDYQIVHELMSVTAPPDAQPALFDLQKKQARWPLSAKQVLDYIHACHQRGLHDEADRACRRGLLFFPLNPNLRGSAKPRQ